MFNWGYECACIFASRDDDFLDENTYNWHQILNCIDLEINKLR